MASLSGPDPAGPPAVRNQMIVVVTTEGGFPAADGQQLPAAEIERLACGSDLHGLVLSAAGEPLWLGRRRRLASDAQWRALIVRDGGCVVCGARPAQCEAHHIEFWEGPQRGRTDLDNLALVCGHHHHLIHDAGHRLCRSDDGWDLRAPP